ncbi:MAG: RNA methyltransferase [Bacteroidetes bacterium]|nr:RNA methyltransferase [Bacteroidota bacterium]
MLTKNQLSDLRLLHDAKGRRKQWLFLAEGPKLITELLHSDWNTRKIYGQPEWIESNEVLLKKKNIDYEVITHSELERVSALATPNQVLATVEIPPVTFDWDRISHDLTLMLDGIMDPGNLGTILRIADWFGISQVICSVGSADIFNPKVVQATMGSLFRVRVFYEKLEDFLQDIPEDVPVYGAFLDGQLPDNCPLENRGILVIGSESHGISLQVASLVKTRIRIPSYPCPGEGQQAESLNASVAAGILCYEFRTKGLKSDPHC